MRLSLLLKNPQVSLIVMYSKIISFFFLLLQLVKHKHVKTAKKYKKGP